MCLLGSAGGAACYAALVALPLWWLDAIAMFGAGVAFYMLHNSMQTEATELAPSARGSAVALFACGFFLGQGLGPLVFGGLLHALGPQVSLVLVAAAIVVLGRVVVAGSSSGRMPLRCRSGPTDRDPDGTTSGAGGSDPPA
jgi:MFS family permease